MKFGDRLRKARTNKGWSQAELSERSGVSQATISKIERGDQEQSVHTPILSATLGVSSLWLATNTGTMHSSAHSVAEPIPSYNITLEHAGAPRFNRRVPIKGRAKLGDDGFYEDITEDGWVDSYSPDADAYGIRVKGDSMHPAIRSGSVVIVEPNGACIPAEFVAIALKNGSKMVKELVAERTDEIIVESVNGNCRQTIEKADILQIHPVAAVVSPSKWRAE